MTLRREGLWNAARLWSRPRRGQLLAGRTEEGCWLPSTPARVPLHVYAVWPSPLPASSSSVKRPQSPAPVLMLSHERFLSTVAVVGLIQQRRSGYRFYSTLLDAIRFRSVSHGV